jgi:thymidylate kinase
MVLIFEGADLAGKTTLATHYSRALRIPIVKIRWDLIDERAETIAFAKVTVGLLAATRAEVILDRSFVSMWAYTPDRDGYVDPLIESLRCLPDVHLVVLTMGAAELHRRYSRAPDEYVSEEQLQAVDRRFAELVPVFGDSLDIVHLDVSRRSAEECRLAIDGHLGVDTGLMREGEVETAVRQLTIPIGEIPVRIAFPK